MSSGVDYLRINAIGAVVISCLTIIAAAYLMWSLWRQGRGKLRVRLLIGMVLSDAFLGIVIMVPELSYVVGRAMQTNTPVCDAFGFLITWALFTQHMWTLAIAIATFLLLKYPLSRSTTFMDHYSWLCFPVIYGLSALHSGLWYRYYGFVSSGNLCYYGSDYTHLTDVNAPNPDPRDLVQFIPRAFVFLVIIVLYSMLFRFLRRPDTIQLSSGFATGTATGTAGTISVAPVPEYTEELDNEKDLGEDRRKSLGPGSALRRMTDRLSTGRSASDATAGPAADIPPWEKLEFVQVGGPSHQSGRTLFVGDATRSQISHMSGSFQPTVSGGIILPSPPQSRNHTPRLSDPTAAVLENPVPPPLSRSHTSSTVQLADIPHGPMRGSDAETIVTPEMRSGGAIGHGGGKEDDALIVDHRSPLDSPIEGEKMRQLGVMSSKNMASSSDSLTSSEGGSVGRRGAKGDRDAKALTEFFQQYQITTDPGLLENAAEAGKVGTKVGKPQLSATAYFNRQASLLMLYFPLAYMLVFSVSLVRLIYDMTTIGPPNPILGLVSAWFVVSIGLIDGLVYGLAEFMVRRRVRRKMPDRM